MTEFGAGGCANERLRKVTDEKVQMARKCRIKFVGDCERQVIARDKA